MSNSLPDNEFGPNIQFREYSFLDNPQAAELNKSILSVELCQVCLRASQHLPVPGRFASSVQLLEMQDEQAPCEPAEGLLKLKPGQNEQQLKSALTDGKAAEHKV